MCLCAFSTNSSGQLNVFWHDRDPLRMNGAQIGVFEQADKICLGCFLKSEDGMALEPEISLEILGNFTDQSLEWELANQKLGALLVFPDLTVPNLSKVLV